jgi:osmotically-inducible protein OsmY
MRYHTSSWRTWLVVCAAALSVNAGCSRDAQIDASREAEQAANATEQAAREAGNELGDAWTTTKIEAKYFSDAGVKGRNIDVTTNGGVVTLRGTVDTEQARQQAVALARGTEGVKRVDDRLVVRTAGESTSVATTGATGSATSGAADVPKYASATDASTAADSGTAASAARPSGWLTTRIQAKYFGDPTVKARKIDVTSHHGIVTLSGAVESNEEREQAVRLARETEGVRRVEDQLRVGAAALQAPAPVTGAAAQAEPGPAAGSGAVTQSLAQERTSDAGITARVQSKFFLDDRVKARGIAVSTSNGTVTLDGSVSSESERQHALSIARSVDGVQDVTDKLQVAAATTAAAGAVTSASTGTGPVDRLEDAWVTTKIQSKYFMDDVVKGRRVNVTTQNGVVTLSGQVHSQAEKQRAEALARETEGVARVQNRLVIGGAAEQADAAPGRPMR